MLVTVTVSTYSTGKDITTLGFVDSEVVRLRF